MWIETILQVDPSSYLMLIPLLICCMLPLLMRQFQGRQTVEAVTDTDVWFVALTANRIFKRIMDEVDEWREEARTRDVATSKGFFTQKPKERFIVEQTIPGRLIKLSDQREGTFVFELTEGAEGKGTLVKTTFMPRGKPRIQGLRANLPIQHPYGEPCSQCGGPLLPGFKFCPYCSKRVGEKSG